MNGRSGATHPGAQLRGYARVLRAPAFRRLWLATVVSRAGDSIYFVALPLFVFDQTGSAAAVTGVVLAEGVGLVAGGALAQLVVDRIPPRRLLIALDFVRAAAAGAIVIAPSFPMAVVVAAVLGAATAGFSPASNALIPRLVDAADLQTANALQWTAGVALQLTVAPLGGILVGAATAQVAFGVNAASFLGSALILARLPRQEAVSVGSGPWRQLPESFRAIGSLPILRALIAMQVLAALSVGATSALLVVLARSAYGLSPTGYGLWLGAIGAGALLGPVLVPLLTRLSPRQTVPTAFVVRGIGDVGLGLLSNGAAGAALLGLYGMNTSSGTVSFQTLVQQEVPETVRGRAFAILDVVWQVGRLVSIALGGVLAVAIGIRGVFVIGGALLVAAGILGWALLTRGGPSES